MKNTSLLIIFLLAVVFSCSAQTPALYNPSADAKSDIAAAVKQAEKSGKHVFVQVGGNWCIWCLRFNQLVTKNDSLKAVVEKNYVVVHVNYSKENKNEAVLASLGYPQRFGFPVFVILDSKRNRLHTQNSAYLEQGEGHSPKKVLEFLKSWTPAALDPRTYSR